MELILEKKFNQQLQGKKFDFGFSVDRDGIYGIEITALAKSWKQNLFTLKSFFKDDDLTVKIDDLAFPKKSGKKGMFDGEIAWNGNNLKGLKKTDLFFIKLSKGSHQLTFLIDQSPNLKVVKIYQSADDEKDVHYLPQGNYPIEEGNRRQWLAIVFVNLGLNSLFVRASAEKRKWYKIFSRDDEDLKLIINGKTQKNQEQGVHQYWYWCGRTLGGRSKQFYQKLNLKSGLHYIEFWADRSPTIEEVKLSLSKILPEPEALPKAKITWQEVNLRKEPTTLSQDLLKLRKGQEVMILQRAIEGEAPYAQESIKEQERDWSNIWHRVQCNEKEGYIFSKSLEIEGENKDSIIKKIVDKAKELNVELPLALAIAKVESQFFPYAVSKKGAKGLFQITEDAKKDIVEEFEVSDDFNINQNIEVGLRYFLKLKNHYYKNDLDAELKAIAAYRAGLDAIKSEIPLNEQKMSRATKRYLEEITKARKEFKKQYKAGRIKGKSLLIFFSMGLILAWSLTNHYVIDDSSRLVFVDDLLANIEKVFPKKVEAIERQTTDGFGKTEKTLRTDIDGDRVLDEVFFKEKIEKTRGLSLIGLEVFFNGKFIHDASGRFHKAFTLDFEQDGKKEVILQTISGQVGRNRIYYYQDNTLKVAKDIFTGVDNLEEESGIYFVDEDSDRRIDYIMLYNFDNPSNCLADSAEIYQYFRGKLIKSMEAKINPDWCKLFDDYN